MLNTFKKSQDLYKNRLWLTFLVLVTLATMVLALCSLLLGCGSDSKPEAVSGKKGKTAAGPNVMKSPGALPLGNLGESSGPGTIKREPNAAGKLEILPGTGVTAEKIEETWAAGVKQSESPNYEILPGMTRQQLEAKIAAAQQKAQKNLESPNYEIVPGMTKQQLDAKIAAAQQKAQKNRESANVEIIPGITRAELEDRVEAARRKGGSQREVAPGITKEELESRVEAARKKGE